MTILTLRDAPPTRKPSTSGRAASSLQLPAFTEPGRRDHQGESMRIHMAEPTWRIKYQATTQHSSSQAAAEVEVMALFAAAVRAARTSPTCPCGEQTLRNSSCLLKFVVLSCTDEGASSGGLSSLGSALCGVRQLVLSSSQCLAAGSCLSGHCAHLRIGYAQQPRHRDSHSPRSTCGCPRGSVGERRTTNF